MFGATDAFVAKYGLIFLRRARDDCFARVKQRNSNLFAQKRRIDAAVFYTLQRLDAYDAKSTALFLYDAF